MRKKSKITKAYDETADKYDHRYRNIQMQKYMQTRIRTLNEIDSNTTKLLLDVGGGTGLLMEFMKKFVPTNQNITYICGDISINMLKVAKNKYPKTSFILFDAEYLPIKPNSIDIITCFSVLQNLNKPKKGIEEIDKALNTKGQGIMTVLEKKISKLNLLSLFKGLDLKLEEVHRLTIEDLAITFRKK